jgi:hypothetical protein
MVELEVFSRIFFIVFFRVKYNLIRVLFSVSFLEIYLFASSNLAILTIISKKIILKFYYIKNLWNYFLF